MENTRIYNDIAARTGGKIYLGVVGGVRTGKSTFIKRFMDTLVIPHIDDDELRRRTIDELPQSASGKTIMTTEPKFIPESAAEIVLDDNVSVSIRMIDSVGYIVPGALGYSEEDRPRMVKTPWFEEEIPFDTAAEIGTKKVITDHSSIGIVVTTDGSVTEIEREEYEESERRVIEELKLLGKPFVVLLNCASPASPSARALANYLSEKYDVTVLPVNCLELDEEEIREILSKILLEFPVREIAVDMPSWVSQLEKDHSIKSGVFGSIRSAAGNAMKIKQLKQFCDDISCCEYVSRAEIGDIDFGTGHAAIVLTLGKGLFCRVISEKSGLDITDESDILNLVRDLSEVKTEYNKIRRAYNEALDTGYGIVMPQTEDLTFEEPQIIKQGTRYGIKLRAGAPSIHMMKTNIFTELTPIVGSQEQSQELVSHLLSEFEEDPIKIWQSNLFGKSLNELVSEGLQSKLSRMPQDARMKLNETVERIINDGCNGLICILL